MPEVRILNSYGDVSAATWDALVADASPFLEHAYLFGLEALECATPETGWTPRPVTVWDDGRLIAAAPGWVKTHSMGEFVYDHSWADAAQRAGFRYYPKLVVAAPFTPVTGKRFLIAPDVDPTRATQALLAGLKAAMKGCHGLHILFNEAAEAEALTEAGGFTRLQYQFHWKNEGYACFDDFLARFRSKNRKNMRRERREANRLRIERVVAPSAAQVDAMYAFYAHTCHQFGPWGRAYLSREFFHHLRRNWGERLLFVLAHDGDQMVAGAFNVHKGDRLYGRYWGCRDEVKFLHFEVCYYQTIEWCIEQGIAVFEPGHGGGHKYHRGFEPTLTYSSHWLADPRLHEGLKHHTVGERDHVYEQLERLREQSPLKDGS